MKNKKIYAIIGMAGSGKTEAVKYLMEKFGWPKIYFGEATFERLEKEGLQLNYENEKMIREKIRQEQGMGAYAKLALPKIEKALETHDTVVIESLYSWDEYKIMKEIYWSAFYTIAIYASPEHRFARLNLRTNERPMTDIDTFNRRNYTEIEGTDKGGPIAMADYTIINQGSVEELHQKLDEIFSKNN
jgi:dephospho-CoA kinase